MTTMVLGRERLECGGRIGGSGQPRWRGTVLHGGILVALATGLVALWTVVALVTALLAHPVPTMTTLEREGARGVPKVLRQGSATVVSELRAGVAGRSAR